MTKIVYFINALIGLLKKDLRLNVSFLCVLEIRSTLLRVYQALIY